MTRGTVSKGHSIGKVEKACSRSFPFTLLTLPTHLTINVSRMPRLESSPGTPVSTHPTNY